MFYVSNNNHVFDDFERTGQTGMTLRNDNLDKKEGEKLYLTTFASRLTQQNN